MTAGESVRRDLMSKWDELYTSFLYSDNPDDAGDMFNIGILYARGEGGLSVDLEKSKNLVIRSAQLGYQPAIDFLKEVLKNS